MILSIDEQFIDIITEWLRDQTRRCRCAPPICSAAWGAPNPIVSSTGWNRSSWAKHFALLNHIALAQGSSQKGLGRRLGLDPSGLVASLDELERDGLVERRPYEGDRRRYALHLTGPGQKKLAAGRKVAQLTADRLLAALSEEEMGVLHDLLARIAAGEFAAGSRGGCLAVVPHHVVHPGLLGGWGCLSHQSQGGHRMKLHANARTCPKSRALIASRVLEQGWSLAAAAEAAGVSERTAGKWVRRFRGEGLAGLGDRSSAPRRLPHAHPGGPRRGDPQAAPVADDGGGDRGAARDAALDGVALAQADRARQALPARAAGAAEPLRAPHGRASSCTSTSRSSAASGGPASASPATSADAQQTTAAGTAAALVGWDFVHVCVDDATRLAYVEVLPDERGASAAAFLQRAVAWFAAAASHVERVMTDNGSATSRTRTPAPAAALGLRHLRTRPYRPRTNGKAERFIQTLQNDWAYGRVYASSAERRQQPARLAQPLQLPTTTRLPQPPAARSPPRRTATNNLTRNYT